MNLVLLLHNFIYPRLMPPIFLVHSFLISFGFLFLYLHILSLYIHILSLHIHILSLHIHILVLSRLTSFILPILIFYHSDDHITYHLIGLIYFLPS